MIKSTWDIYKMPGLNNGVDRRNAHYQVMAMANYLSTIKINKSCSWEEALAYYHTGEGIKNISYAQLKSYVNANPVIAAQMEDYSPKGYFAAAVAYYNRSIG